MTSLPSYIVSFLVGCMAIISIPVAAQDIPASLPDTTVATELIGETTLIPVTVDESVDGENVISFDVHVRYDSDVLDVTGIEMSGTDVENDWQATVNLNDPDTVRVSLTSGTAASGGPGVLLWIEATPLVRGVSELEFTYYRAGPAAPTTTNGVVVVNDPPEIDSAPGDQSYLESDDTAEIELAPIFTNPHNDDLSYTATSSNTDVLETSIDEAEGLLVLTFGQAGEANVTLEVEDEVGSTAETSFVVTVEESTQPAVENPIEDLTLTIDTSHSIDLTSVFSHPDGEVLVFSATSSNEEVVLATVDGTTLELEAVGGGEADVTVTAEDEQGDTAEDVFTVSVQEPPQSLPVSINRNFGDPSQAGQYRLVALPGDAGISVAQTVEGSSPDDWRALYDNGQNENYLVEYDGSGSFDFRPGRGFWLISKEAWSIEQEIPAVSPTAGSYHISVHQGWNIISNPFDVNLDWSAVQNASDTPVQALWSWNGGWNTTTTFASAMSGEAYYVYAEEAGSLVLPYSAGSTADATEDAAELTDMIRLTATSDWNDYRTSSSVEVGTSPVPEALSRLAAPPEMAERLSLRLVNEGEEGREAKLARLLKTDAANGARFDLTLRAEEAPQRGSVTLQLDADELWPGQQLVLVEKATGRTFDLHVDPTARIEMSGTETRQLHLLVGSASYVEGEQGNLAPDELSILANYPNPFSSRTTIEYSLPEDGDVSATVYDLLGRQVRVLASSPEKAGFHELVWDGRDDAGVPVASGMYIVQLRALGQSLSHRVVVVR